MAFASQGVSNIAQSSDKFYIPLLLVGGEGPDSIRNRLWITGLSARKKAENFVT